MSWRGTKSSQMNFGIQPLLGRRAYEAEILCLHNNTYSTMFRRVEYSLTLPNHFRATGAKAFLHTSVGMATLNAYTRHCCCYIRNTNIFASVACFRCWYAIVFECIDSWAVCKPGLCAGADRTCPVSTDGTSWTGRANLPDWLSLSVSHTVTGYQSNWMHTYRGNELSFGEAKLFASKLQNFNLGRITPENGWGTVVWAQDCSTAVVYLLKCWEAH